MVALVGAVVSNAKDYHNVNHQFSILWECMGPLVFVDPPLNGVICGAHSAPTCAECTHGNGAGWCHGQCSCDYTKSVCFKPGKIHDVL